MLKLRDFFEGFVGEGALFFATVGATRPSAIFSFPNSEDMASNWSCPMIWAKWRGHAHVYCKQSLARRGPTLSRARIRLAMRRNSEIHLRRANKDPDYIAPSTLHPPSSIAAIMATELTVRLTSYGSFAMRRFWLTIHRCKANALSRSNHISSSIVKHKAERASAWVKVDGSTRMWVSVSGHQRLLSRAATLTRNARSLGLFP